MWKSSTGNRHSVRNPTFLWHYLARKHPEIALRKDKLNGRVVARGALNLIQCIAIKRLAIWILLLYNIEAAWHFLPLFSFTAITH